MPKVKVYTDRTDRSGKGTGDLYETARNLIEQEQYGKALGQLDLLIARFDGKVTRRLDRQSRRRGDVLEGLRARQTARADRSAQNARIRCRRRFADSRWLKDAMALKVEVMQASGQAVSPDSQTDEDLKLLALRGLMQSDPDRAVPMIEQVLVWLQLAQGERERAVRPEPEPVDPSPRHPRQRREGRRESRLAAQGDSLPRRDEQPGQRTDSRGRLSIVVRRSGQARHHPQLHGQRQSRTARGHRRRCQQQSSPCEAKPSSSLA